MAHTPLTTHITLDPATIAEAVRGFIATLAEVDPNVVGVLGLVEEEVAAQDVEWGEQNHPMHTTDKYDTFNASKYERQSVLMKRVNAGRVTRDTLAWDTILLEEVFEALAETDLDRQVEELVQVAAVAVNMIVSLNRQAA